ALAHSLRLHLGGMNTCFQNPLFEIEIAGVQLNQDIAGMHFLTLASSHASDSSAGFRNHADHVAFRPNNPRHFNRDIDRREIGPGQSANDENRQHVGGDPASYHYEYIMNTSAL